MTGSISSWSARSTTHSSPLSIATGSTSSDACAAAGTARTSPRITRLSSAVPGGGQPGIQRVGGDGRARSQVGEHLGVRVVRGDQRTGDRRRHERAGHRAVAELGQHDGQLENAETLPANGFGQVHALQALFGRGLPIRRRVCRSVFPARRATPRTARPAPPGTAPNRPGLDAQELSRSALVAFPCFSRGLCRPSTPNLITGRLVDHMGQLAARRAAGGSWRRLRSDSAAWCRRCTR